MDTGLQAADVVVLVLYLIGMTFIGVRAAKKIMSSSDFFMPRRFGKVMMVMFGFGSGTHSDQAVSVASKSFTNGLSGIWYQWLWLPVSPFYWLIAPVFRRFRAITTSDVFEARFGPSVAVLFVFIGILNLTVSLGVMLKGSSEVISASTGGLVHANVVIAAMTVIFVIYGVAGGLSAAIITDFIQGVLTIFFSFLLLPFILDAVGGFEGMREQLAEGELSLVAPADITAFTVVVLAINALVGIVAQPHTMANCAAGKTEMEGRVGFMGGSLLKRICTIPWCLTGVAGIVYFADKGIDPDKVFGAVAGDFLPKILPGILGLFIAALLASVMSTCDAFMISSSALFTENVYKRANPNESRKHYVLVGRITSVVMVAGGVGFAYVLPGVVKGLEIFWKVTPMMGIVFWLGLFWRRANVSGAWASVLAAAGIWLFTSLSPGVYLTSKAPLAEEAGFVFLKERNDSALIVDCEVRDTAVLAEKIKRGEEPVSAYIKSTLSESTQSYLQEYKDGEQLSEEVERCLITDLNRIIEESELAGEEQEEIAGLEELNLQKAEVFYRPERFSGVELSERAKELISKRPTGEGMMRLNRRLLEEAYPEHLLRHYLFSAVDIEKPFALVEKLENGGNKVCEYLWGRFDESSRRFLAGAGVTESEAVGELLASELNKIANGENIYKEAIFGEIGFLKGSTVKAAKVAETAEQFLKANTYLIEESFPWCISKNRKPVVHLPWQMVFYLVGGFGMGIIVSLLTSPVGKDKLDNFYALLRTPVRSGEQVEMPCTLPAGAVAGEKRNLLPFKSLEIPVPTLTGMMGFLAGWLFVACIILVVCLIAS